MAGSIQYIKISKIDKTGVDLTTQLESINTLVLPSASKFVEYTILNKSRFNDYFLYYVTPPNRENIDNAITSSLDYNFTSSLSTSTISFVVIPGGQSLYPATINGLETQLYQNVNINGTNNFSIDKYPGTSVTLNTVSQKSIEVGFNFTASISSGTTYFRLYSTNGETLSNDLNISPLFSAGTNTYSISASLAPGTITPGSGFALVAYAGGGGGGNSVEFSFNSTSHFFASSSAATGDALQNTIIEPYFTTDFYKSEYDVLQNNATKGIPNQLLQNINYNSGIIPTNIEAIMSGSAVKADIPQSNYEISSLINPSYNFSIVQSSDVNVYDPLARGTDFGDPVNIGNYGQTPSISDLDTTIYEFEWGGGTTPEILDFGAIKMGRLLSTSSPDLIKTINPSSNYKNQSLFSRTPAISQSLYNINPKYSGSTSDYYLTLNGNNPINHRINMYLYNSTAGTNPTLPSTAKILTTDFGVPTISNYMVTSSYPTIYGKWGYGKDSIEFRFKTSDIGGNDPKFSRVNTGYVPGSGVNVASATSGTSLTGNNTIINEITTDINNGERWFMSMYFGTLESGFDSNDLVSLDSLNSILASPTADLRDINGDFINPLTRKGVVEILGANTGSTAYTASFLINTINDYKLQIPGFGSFEYDFNFGSGSWGFLMWKARAAGKNEFVIVQDSLSGGINAGAFTSAFVPEYLTENFEAITKEYGSNQTG